MTSPGREDEESGSEVDYLNSPAEFREAILAISQNTRRELSVFSPDLTATLYDRPELEQALSDLARRHRRAQIRLLVADTQALVERGHSLVRLAQRLPSKIRLRKLTNDIECKAPSFILSDREHLLYQNDREQYRGFLDTQAAGQVKTLREIFDRAWESAEEDPRLRPLFL